MKNFLLLILFSSLLLPLHVFSKNVIKIATTTSLEDSSLLKKLVPAFEKKYGLRVDVIATGSGSALKLAENGDIDLVFVHDPGAEEKFVEAGYGINRRRVMYNTFVILGPEEDSAEVKNSGSPSQAFEKIFARKAIFISRGDNSGTHEKELLLWEASGLSPKGEKWYQEVGQGMATTILIANEKKGYALTDRGTYLALKNKIDLQIVFEGDESLMNPYSVIAVNPEKYPKANYQGALLFIDWVTSADGQKIIQDYKIDGEQLFYPCGIK